MARRTIEVSQAEITRTAKALRAAGFDRFRVITRRDRVEFEFPDSSQPAVNESPADDEPEIVL